MISSTSIAGISASQPRPNVLAGPETAYRPPPHSLDGMSDDGNMTQAQMDRIVAEKASQHVSYGFQIPSETLDRVRAEGREPTMAELDKIHEETKEISFALHGFVKAGIADPLTAAREAVAKTRAQQFDSRQSALSDAVQSFDTLFRIKGAISASLSSIASAESVREGASTDVLSVINHVVARENGIQGMLNGRANVAVAMLERDFTVSGNILEREESGAMRLGAFELSHGTYGKLLSVDDAGNVTLYGQNGDELDATAYVNALFGSDSVFSIAGNRPRANLIDRHL